METGGSTTGGTVAPASIHAWLSVKHTTGWHCTRHNLTAKIATKRAVSLPLHESMPSPHVWSNRTSPASPHLLNQAPPRAQQLSLPLFLVMPHAGHAATAGVVAPASIDAWALVKHTKLSTLHQI